MPDTERRILKGHQTRLLVLVGLGLIAAGGALVLVGAGTLRPEPRVPAPAAVVHAIGVVFVVLGAWLLAIRIGNGLRDARAPRLRRTMPGAPWLADHPWDPAGARDKTGRRAIAAAALAVILGLSLVPFNWVAFFPRSGIHIWGRILFVVVTGIVLGTSDRVWLRVPRAPAACRLTAALRCIEERYVADGESSSTLSEQVWAETVPVEPAWGRFGEGWNLPIALRLPLGPYETGLADRPPRYWELEVHGAAPGVDFGATFLLPVYTALAAPSGPST